MVNQELALVFLSADWSVHSSYVEQTVLANPDVLLALRCANVQCFRVDWTDGRFPHRQAMHDLDFTGPPMIAIFPRDGSASPEIMPAISDVRKFLDCLTLVEKKTQ